MARRAPEPIGRWSTGEAVEARWPAPGHNPLSEGAVLLSDPRTGAALLMPAQEAPCQCGVPDCLHYSWDDGLTCH